MVELLNTFAEEQAAKGQERMARKSKDFEQSSENTTNRKLNYRQVCFENHLELWGGSEVQEKIEKLCALGYYTRKPLKSKDLRKNQAAGMNDAAGYIYTVKEETSTSTHGTASSSTYSFEKDVKECSQTEVVLV